jgi:hypothetical protein
VAAVAAAVVVFVMVVVVVVVVVVRRASRKPLAAVGMSLGLVWIVHYKAYRTC